MANTEKDIEKRDERELPEFFKDPEFLRWELSRVSDSYSQKLEEQHEEVSRLRMEMHDRTFQQRELMESLARMERYHAKSIQQGLKPQIFAEADKVSIIMLFVSAVLCCVAFFKVAPPILIMSGASFIFVICARHVLAWFSRRRVLSP